jgi:hypothetical protein
MKSLHSLVISLWVAISTAQVLRDRRTLLTFTVESGKGWHVHYTLLFQSISDTRFTMFPLKYAETKTIFTSWFCLEQFGQSTPRHCVQDIINLRRTVAPYIFREQTFFQRFYWLQSLVNERAELYLDYCHGRETHGPMRVWRVAGQCHGALMIG